MKNQTQVRRKPESRKWSGSKKEPLTRLFLITHTLTAYLQVYCKDEEEARAWENRIVAGLEDEDGNPIPPDAVCDFEADCYPDRMEIELLEEN
ncbi:MAG: hypothetical protein AB1817_01130 [Chloroflexota bacterium]